MGPDQQCDQNRHFETLAVAVGLRFQFCCVCALHTIHSIHYSRGGRSVSTICSTYEPYVLARFTAAAANVPPSPSSNIRRALPPSRRTRGPRDLSAVVVSARVYGVDKHKDIHIASAVNCEFYTDRTC